MVAEERAGDGSCYNCANNDGAERTDVEIAKNDFDSEHHPAKRSIEDRGNPACGTGSHKRAELIARQPEELPYGGARCCADENDRPFPPRSPTRADAECGCNRLGKDKR